jgi:hypothetical protein
LHQKAWAIVKPLFEQELEKAAARYRELAGWASETASKKLDEIVPAAFHGRIETLFVAVGIQRWGTFNREEDSVLLHCEPQPGDRDLLDFAAAWTHRNGGMVYALEPQRLPDSAAAAAIFRY